MKGTPGPQGLVKVHTWAHAEQCWEKQRSPRTKSGDIHTLEAAGMQGAPPGPTGPPFLGPQHW